jgi:hypothetical protein
VSKATRGLGFGRRSGTVTVIEERVHRSSARNARMAFIVTFIIVAVLTATVASDHMHPILAGLLGVLVAFVAGTLVWAVVRVWPVLRVLMWWTPEIGAALTLVYGWLALADATPAWLTLAITAPLIGVPAAVPAIRKWVVAIAWCFIVRHRLRVCFSQFIIANRSGSLPLILWARPTPVGERVWVYLRPGLSLSRLQQRLDEITVACHADSVLADRANETGNAAYVRFDIKRNKVLTGTVSSPLVGVIDTDTIPTAYTAPTEVPGGLDLPDVADETPLATAAKSAKNPNGKKPANAAPAAAPVDDDPWD